MRGVRFALFAGWMAMSLLAVAGFAAFSAQPPQSTTATTATVATDLGAATGSLSALGFAYLVEHPRPDPLEGADRFEAIALAERVNPTRTTVTSPAPPPVTTPSTTPATTATTPATTRPPAMVLTEEEVRALVTTYFRPEDVERAIDVAYCESTFNASAVNPRTGASGLFQHMPRYWSERSTLAGWAGASIFDPVASTAVGAWLLYSDSAGWAHWDC